MLYLIQRFRQFPIQCRSRSTLFKLLIRQASSSNKSGGGGGGPAREKLKAIPFEQHVKAAEKVKTQPIYFISSKV